MSEWAMRAEDVEKMGREFLAILGEWVDADGRAWRNDKIPGVVADDEDA